MQISSKSNISFYGIELSNVEKEKSTAILEQLKTPNANSDKLKAQLMDVFDKQIQIEAKNKAGLSYYFEDVLQEMYLNFFETVHEVKDLTTEKLIDVLNNFKPKNNELKEEKRLDTKSLSSGIKSDVNHPLESIITEKNLPKYMHTQTHEAREKMYNKIELAASDAELKHNEAMAVLKRARGKLYSEIAEEGNISYFYARHLVQSGIAKIQGHLDVLPKEYDVYAKNLKNKLNLPQSFDEIKEALMSEPELLNYSEEKIFNNVNKVVENLGLDFNEYTNALLKFPTLFKFSSGTIIDNIKTTSEMLNVEPKTYVQTLFKHPKLLALKPETIYNNVKKSAGVLKLDLKTYIDTGLQTPELFYMKPETITNNIQKTADLLAIPKNTYMQAALKKPTIFYFKRETIVKNINDTAKLLDITPENFIKSALKQPQLFYQKPETILKNITDAAKALNISPKLYIKAALKQPPLFYQKSETILKNITEAAKALNVDSKLFIKASLRQPQLFCLKPETILKNATETAKALDIDSKLFINAALREPSLFCFKPETIVKKVMDSSRLLDMEPKSFVKIALKSPNLFYQKPETLYKKLTESSKFLRTGFNSPAQMLLNQPYVTKYSPETICKKVEMMELYCMLQSKKVGKPVLNTSSETELFEKMLNVLVKKNDNLSKAIDKKDFINYLANANKIYEFTIPDYGEAAKGLVAFAKEFSQKAFGKQIFKFVLYK